MQVAAMLCLLRLAPVQGRNKRSKNQRIAGCRYSHRKLKKGESIEEKITNRLMKMSLASSKMKMTIMKRKTMKMKIAMMMVMTMTTMMMNIVVKNRIIIERKRINLQERSSGNQSGITIINKSVDSFTVRMKMYKQELMKMKKETVVDQKIN